MCDMSRCLFMDCVVLPPVSATNTSNDQSSDTAMDIDHDSRDITTGMHDGRKLYAYYPDLQLFRISAHVRTD